MQIGNVVPVQLAKCVASCHIDDFHIKETPMNIYTMVSVYLSECDTWSDGEDEHEEDHNFYYDLKYFVLEENPNYMCIYAWQSYKSHEYHGMITFWDSPMHLMEINCSKEVDKFTKEKCKRLVECELERMRNKIQFHRDKNFEICIECGKKFIERLGVISDFP